MRTVPVESVLSTSLFEHNACGSFLNATLTLPSMWRFDRILMLPADTVAKCTPIESRQSFFASFISGVCVYMFTVVIDKTRQLMFLLCVVVALKASPAYRL